MRNKLPPQLITEPIRVAITTDAGADPDDYSSLVHLLLYWDILKIEMIIVGHPGNDITGVKKLCKSYGIPVYPGATRAGQGTLSVGAHRLALATYKPGTLHIFTWGAVTDLARALKYAPSIVNNIKVFSIGSWNREQDKTAWNFLENTPKLWWVYTNSTFRWYLAFDKAKNKAYVDSLKPLGKLGRYIYDSCRDTNTGKGTLKAGDTASVLFAATNGFADPTKNTWGGSYKKVGKTTWTDKSDPKLAVGQFLGVKTMAKYINLWLKDMKKRLKLEMV